VGSLGAFETMACPMIGSRGKIFWVFALAGVLAGCRGAPVHDAAPEAAAPTQTEGPGPGLTRGGVEFGSLGPGARGSSGTPITGGYPTRANLAGYKGVPPPLPTGPIVILYAPGAGGGCGAHFDQQPKVVHIRPPGN